MNEWYSQDVETIAKQNDQRIRREITLEGQLAAMRSSGRSTIAWTQRTLAWAGDMLVNAGMTLQRAAR